MSGGDLEAAEHVADVLGQMKGAAMKAGQMASLMDVNRLPSDELGAFQARFEELRDSAPRVPFKDMHMGTASSSSMGSRLAVYRLAVPARCRSSRRSRSTVQPV